MSVKEPKAIWGLGIWKRVEDDDDDDDAYNQGIAEPLLTNDGEARTIFRVQ